jgi:hypothetical protein
MYELTVLVCWRGLVTPVPAEALDRTNPTTPRVLVKSSIGSAASNGMS